MIATLFGMYQITIRELPNSPGLFDYWIFINIDPDYIHHGAGYSSRAAAREAAELWIEDRRRGFR